MNCGLYRGPFDLPVSGAVSNSDQQTSFAADNAVILSENVNVTAQLADFLCCSFTLTGAVSQSSGRR